MSSVPWRYSNPTVRLGENQAHLPRIVGPMAARYHENDSSELSRAYGVTSYEPCAVVTPRRVSVGEERATGFLKKFYGWYLGRGRFPKPFKQELVQLPTVADVEERLLAAAPGASAVLERLSAELPTPENVTLDLPVSIYAGG